MKRRSLAVLVTLDDGTSTPWSSLGSGTLTWQAIGVVSGANTNNSGGNISGFLTATIDWDDSKPTTIFHTECVLIVWTAVTFLVDGRYYGVIEDFPLLDGDRPAGDTAFATGVASLHLERVSSHRADLDFLLGLASASCFQQEQFTIHKDNSVARGDKTGNGGRAIDACER